MVYAESSKNKLVDKQEYIPNQHEIIVTEAVIEAGIEEAREFALGENLEGLVTAVFYAMLNELKI